MKFHLPSFVLGVATGASATAIAPRLRPVVLELATGCYRVFDAAMLRVARGRENLSDLVAEARSRARDRLHVERGEPRPTPPSEPPNEPPSDRMSDRISAAMSEIVTEAGA